MAFRNLYIQSSGSFNFLSPDRCLVRHRLDLFANRAMMRDLFMHGTTAEYAAARGPCMTSNFAECSIGNNDRQDVRDRAVGFHPGDVSVCDSRGHVLLRRYATRVGGE